MCSDCSASSSISSRIQKSPTTFRTGSLQLCIYRGAPISFLSAQSTGRHWLRELTILSPPPLNLLWPYSCSSCWPHPSSTSPAKNSTDHQKTVQSTNVQSTTMNKSLDPETGVKTFEELRIFQAARKLCNDIGNVTGTGSASKDFTFSNQVRRAALSILSNVAEGFERNSQKEFAQFLSIAKGSCGEVRAQLLVALDQKYVTEQQHNKLQAACIQLSSGIARLMAYLRQHPVSARRNSESKLSSS